MIVKEAFVRCDACGRRDSKHGPDHGAATTRSIARAAGFVRRVLPGNEEPWDLCPICDAASPGEEPGPPDCPDHKPVQHRDRQPPWCPRCGWTSAQPAVPARQITIVGEES